MKKKKSGRKILLLAVIILVLFPIAIKLYYDNQIMPVSIDNSSKVAVEIPKGSSSSKIAEILKENNLIRNKHIFRIIAKLGKNDGKLKAGRYELSQSMTPNEIIAQLVKGGKFKDSVSFTIPEGFELKHIAEKLSDDGLVNKDRFMELVKNPSLFTNKYEFIKEIPKGNTLEGYLFPDTYQVYIDSSEEVIIEKMLSRFNEIYIKEIKERSSSLDLSINELITLASVIEREGKRDDERKLISSVFHNRLKQGMLLQSCATVQYVLGERKENLTYDDLKIESEYNTYIHEGLPPGPIAAPGLPSIIAAIEPVDSDFLFFVSNGDGSHTFSKTLKDHNNAKNKN